MRPLGRDLGLKMLFLERVCTKCCGGGITMLVSGSLEFTYIQVGDETMLIGEGGGEVRGRDDS
jgi:hypothetical protein